ncbi:sodium-translocating pyrophosphatase [Thiospirochaeta perfilievii]|uniref:Putative K(+)-stimulated pyrophosphate-energized sodium pump n=1 Tax=Thiospirochaeta perfilievii TaxID=252967 RepID=A0A5C1QCV0_9SPIO|nr:sodium-translocating pyrophosphatase [Thiospirochaeta perfilievii]QEN04534.1 sodium-translocating pyrophosphatase [Thiospirochaeta perfilievii]
MNWVIYIALATSIITLGFALLRTKWIYKQPIKEGKLVEIAGHISDGAMAFLKREYTILIPFIIIVSLFLGIGNKGYIKLQFISFILGAICSALAGYIGMKVATASNSRTTTAAENSLNSALKVAFRGGSVMGLTVTGLALLGLFLVLFIGSLMFGLENTALKEVIFPILTGYSLGASSVALFARVGGGIYTKAADVGADLVGKVEAGIPEDDPRNPATIADNVGDNVGDVAGMGADLFESFVGSIVGAMILGISAIATDEMQIKLAFFPIIIVGVGAICSIIGMYFVRIKDGISAQFALNMGTFGASILTTALVLPVSYFMFKGEVFNNGSDYLDIFIATVAGLAAGVGIGISTQLYTGTGTGPVKKIVKACKTGSATNIISGLGVGMLSTVAPIIILVAAILIANELAGFYGVGISALGMLLTLSIQLAVDAYGPIADNAGGLAVMAEFPKQVRERTDELDAVGNTTAAIGKGFAIGSAALTSIILFASFQEVSGVGVINLVDTKVLSGVFLGAMIPFLFSALAIDAVGKAAFDMIEEVRRQFKEKKGIIEGTETPDYKRCIDISTKSALSKMMPPGIIAIVTPIIIGFTGGPAMLAGLLVGVTSSGVLMATFMSNSGGAWDNAKKMIEADEKINKGEETYKASVVGDTVGDPFKDTAGPSLNILIKLMAVISLVIAPMLNNFWG